MKFTRDGQVWEAVQFQGFNLPQILRMLKGMPQNGSIENDVLSLDIAGGKLNVPKGCWLLRSGKVLRSESAESFSANYSAVE